MRGEKGGRGGGGGGKWPPVFSPASAVTAVMVDVFTFTCSQVSQGRLSVDCISSFSLALVLSMIRMHIFEDAVSLAS